jgi:hypothetical protein
VSGKNFGFAGAGASGDQDRTNAVLNRLPLRGA